MKKPKLQYIITRIGAALCVLCALTAALLVLLYLCAAKGAVSMWTVGALALLFLALLYAILKFVYQPYQKTKRILDLFATGYTLEGAYDPVNPYDESMQKALWKLKEYLSTHEIIDDGRRQAQYLALQNQINPHFLYNTLEGIRGEALAAGLDSVAEMTEALATFFRYTISNVENFVTVEDELTNIDNYFIIQQFRFGDRLALVFEYDKNDWKEIKKCRLPKLTLQPIAENSIIHGIERKLGQGTLKIKVEITRSRLLITVSDDGVGMSDEKLKELNDKLNIRSFDSVKTNPERRGGIAIQNVNNRIKLLFGEEYGIHIYSKAEVGTDVTITLPRITKADE